MLKTRHLNPADIDLICDHRANMFLEAGKDADAASAMAPPFRNWLQGHLAAETYFGFITEEDGKPAGSVGLMSIDWPPHPEHPDEAHRGYVLNLYIEKPYRKQGLASMLMKKSEDEFRRRNISYLILHPTAMARPLYESMGWQISGEMIKKLVR